MTEQNIPTGETNETIDNRPYVISADIKLVLEDWAEKGGFTLPSDEFFSNLRQDFSSYMTDIFPGFEMVTEEALQTGITKLVRESKLFPISIDATYYQSDAQLTINRLMKTPFEQRPKPRLGRRPGRDSLMKQFKELRDLGLKQATVVDDVVFFGEQLSRIVNTLRTVGIDVPVVIAGISVGEGKSTLTDMGIEVRSVKDYLEVIDEVCERDFYPGVPYSGRTLLGNSNTGVPYLLPFGNPVDWASIPQGKAQDLSRFCIGQTQKLFDEIGRVSERPVLYRDVDRKVFGLPEEFGNDYFTDVLEAVK